MIAPDSSVVIAALAPWHAAHEQARTALAGTEARLIAHVAYETTSALSRMPEGRRVAPQVVLEALNLGYPDEWLQLAAGEARSALERAVAAGLRGGTLYDALIAATAAAHGAELLSADRRARRAYDALGVRVTELSI